MKIAIYVSLFFPEKKRLGNFLCLFIVNMKHLDDDVSPKVMLDDFRVFRAPLLQRGPRGVSPPCDTTAAAEAACARGQVGGRAACCLRFLVKRGEKSGRGRRVVLAVEGCYCCWPKESCLSVFWLVQ